MFRAGAALLALLSMAPFAVAAARCGPATVQLVVLDQGGTALSGLAPSDFKVRIKGQSANVTAVDYGVFPHTTLLLVSRTSTMGQSIKIELARRIADVLVAGAPGIVMVGTYSGDVSAIEDGRGGPSFSAGLQAGPDPRNVIYDAVLAGMSTMKLHRGDAVVVLTDSPDNGSKTVVAELQQHFVATGARLFVVALPPATGAGSMQPLTNLADNSGGAFIVPLHVDDTTKGVIITPSQIDGAVPVLTHDYAQYNNIYQLETDIDGQDRPMPLKVEVERRKMGGGKVVAPAMLAPCSATLQ